MTIETLVWIAILIAAIAAVLIIFLIVQKNIQKIEVQPGVVG